MLGLLTLILALSMVPNASALTDWVDISIDHAYYYDLDDDGISDDVLVNITCTVRDGMKHPSKSEYHVALTLPSGLVYLVIIEVTGKYNTIFMSLKMFDTATESGWYNVRVDGYGFGIRRGGYSTTTYDFDPPTGAGTGQPHVELLAYFS